MNAPGATCTIQLRAGGFCERKADPRIGYPVCSRHARRIFQDVLTNFHADASPLQRTLVALGYEPKAPLPTKAAQLGKDQVYYLLIDGLVKIGRTTNLKQRLQSYPPTTQLLATEPGHKALEAQRLAEFREYRTAGREWFTPGPRLRVHIESLPDYRDAA